MSVNDHTTGHDGLLEEVSSVVHEWVVTIYAAANVHPEQSVGWSNDPVDAGYRVVVTNHHAL